MGGIKVQAILLTIAFAISLVESQPDRFNVAEKGAPSEPLRRDKRNYYHHQRAPFQNFPFQNYDPVPYTITRPYYIPVLQFPNRVPIYYAPQPAYVNPGFPPHNPPTPNRGYLPSRPTDNRFGGDDDDDRPVWGGGNQVTTARPPSFKPTRPPRPSNPTSFPPLVHGNKDQTGNELRPDRPQTTTVRPPVRPTVRPQRPTQPPTTSPPDDQVRLDGLSQCVWATVSCCSGVNAKISYDCFEQLGCHGAFWDTNPCDSDFAKAAIAAALNYYNR